MLKGRLTRSLDAAVRHLTKNRMKIPITVLQSELVDAHAAAGLRFPSETSAVFWSAFCKLTRECLPAPPSYGAPTCLTLHLRWNVFSQHNVFTPACVLWVWRDTKRVHGSVSDTSHNWCWETSVIFGMFEKNTQDEFFSYLFLILWAWQDLLFFSSGFIQP